jgi:hypothetical protein
LILGLITSLFEKEELARSQGYPRKIHFLILNPGNICLPET